MSFFEPPPPRPPEPEQRERPPWVGPPDEELGVVVPVERFLARTDRALVSIRALTAYRDGFTVAVAIRRKPKPEDFDPRRMHLHGAMFGPFWGEDVPDEFVRFGVQFADGSKATNLESPAWVDSEKVTKTPVMMPRGGGGGSHGAFDMTYWIWPLPPSGPLTFVCEWPSEAIGEQRAELDAGTVLEASGLVESIWPAT